MTPTMIHTSGKGDIYKRSPFGALRFFEQIHSGLVREFVPLARVAWDAGADNIFPSGLSSSVAWQDMIDIEMIAIKNGGAVLAGILIPLKNIVPRELDLFFWQAVKDAEDDDPRNANPQGNCLEHSRLGIQQRKITPACEIVREKIADSGICHDLCMALIEQR